jgi:hypothetical protein
MGTSSDLDNQYKANAEPHKPQAGAAVQQSALSFLISPVVELGKQLFLENVRKKRNS